MSGGRISKLRPFDNLRRLRISGTDFSTRKPWPHLGVKSFTTIAVHLMIILTLNWNQSTITTINLWEVKLDFSCWIPHECFLGRNEVMYQNDMRKLKNRPEKSVVDDTLASSDGLANKTLYVVKARHREDSNNHDGAIPSHHNAATNRGYSRKHDGGIFSI